ncbi:hypothetical protein [Streptomyces sp. NPDC052225]|uniref:hypothetical protein n=1 Tax=Streptomyces sp. NPDC052225 TaxID=3154949 RepID=UPI00344383FE
MAARLTDGIFTALDERTVTVLAVRAHSAELWDARTRALEKLLAGVDHRVLRPVGLQAQLFTLALPRSVRPRAVREFPRHQVAEDWAMSGAFTRSEVGDPNGTWLGTNPDRGTTRPVMVPVADTPTRNASATLAVVGDLGGGKSVLQKTVQSAVVDRGAAGHLYRPHPGARVGPLRPRAAPGRCRAIEAAQAELALQHAHPDVLVRTPPRTQTPTS